MRLQPLQPYGQLLEKACNYRLPDNFPWETEADTPMTFRNASIHPTASIAQLLYRYCHCSDCT